MSEVRTVELGKILKPEQVRQVMNSIEARNSEGLRAYLRSISCDLAEHGVVADYLYYLLCWKFKLL